MYDAHWNDDTHEHMVQPGMVYISQPTENGTLYSKEELRALHETCEELGLPLFLDGARMGYGLMSEENTLALEDIAALTDVFYIGGTKVGALFGEAVVIVNPALKKDFRYMAVCLQKEDYSAFSLRHCSKMDCILKLQNMQIN